MKSFLTALFLLLIATPLAYAGGNSSGFASGFGNAMPDAQIRSLCAAALQRQLAGGPPAPIACAAPPQPVYVAPTPTRPQRCETNSYYSINGVPQYTMRCY